jgi:hypothetical protein
MGLLMDGAMQQAEQPARQAMAAPSPAEALRFPLSFIAAVYVRVPATPRTAAQT